MIQYGRNKIIEVIMKYIVILGDGWADYPDEKGETPLSLADKPNIDRIASVSVCGLMKTVPDGMTSI